jgi:diaminopimelate epimerase
VHATPSQEGFAIMRFSKWQGIGNDYLIVHSDEWSRAVDAETSRSGGLAESVASALSTAICDRHFGIGGDGILVIGPSEVADAKMVIYNPDGSYAEMCGNGIRMAARYLAQSDSAMSGEIAIETAGGIMRPTVLDDGTVRVDMGTLTTNGHSDVVSTSVGSWNGREVSVGNPHFVIRANPDTVDLPHIGPALEHHEHFPNRTNVEFYEVVDNSHVRMRVWERGVGETLACGTGACAVGLTAVADAGCVSPVTVSLPGGDLIIDVDDDLRVFMTGAARLIYQGSIDLDALMTEFQHRTMETVTA